MSWTSQEASLHHKQAYEKSCAHDNLTLRQCNPEEVCIHMTLGALYSYNNPTVTTPLPVSLPNQGDTLATVLSIQHMRHLAQHHIVHLLFHAHTQTRCNVSRNTSTYI